MARAPTTTSRDFEGAPPDLNAAELDEAKNSLANGEVVRVALPRGRIALCESLDDVKMAQRGKIPPNAMRLDRGVTR